MLPSGRLRAALVALYVITRLRGLGLLPIFLDETLHVRWALLVSQGDKPWDATWKWGRALTIWMGALVSPWAQDLLRANRLVSVAIGVATLFATFEIARRLLGPREALVAGLFYVLCPFTLFYDRMALTEAGLSAAFALTLVFSIRISESGRPLDAALAGLMLVLAVLVKAIGVLVLPIPLVTLLVLGRIRERWKALALAYAVGVPPIALALRLFVASENAQHMAQLFTGGGGALAARLGQNLAEGAGWLWTWWTAPLVVLGAIGALVALGRRDRKGLLLALLALYPLVAFSAVLTWRMPRYLLPASVPLLVLAAGALVRLASWAAERLPASAGPLAREGRAGVRAGRGAAPGAAARSGLLDRSVAGRDSRARPLPVRARLALGLRRARHRAAGPAGARAASGRGDGRRAREPLPEPAHDAAHARTRVRARAAREARGLGLRRPGGAPGVREMGGGRTDAARGPPRGPERTRPGCRQLAASRDARRPHDQARRSAVRRRVPALRAAPVRRSAREPLTPGSGTLPPVQITRIRAYRVELPLHEGSYKWSGGKSVSVFDSTIVAVETDTGVTG